MSLLISNTYRNLVIFIDNMSPHTQSIEYGWMWALKMPPPLPKFTEFGQVVKMKILLKYSTIIEYANLNKLLSFEHFNIVLIFKLYSLY